MARHGRSGVQGHLTDLGMPAGTFFDIAVVHLLTTSPIDRLRGRLETRRFRRKIVVSIAATSSDKDSARPVSASSRRTYVRSSFHMINMAPGSNDTASGNDMKAPG